MSTLYTKLNGSAHVYTLDQRGSGSSTRFECLSATTSQPLPAASVTGAQVAICAQQLEQKFGKDLSVFSVTSAASDVAAFIAKYHSSAKSFVYGVSYGSVLVERLIHLNPVGVSGYVLDAIRTTSGANQGGFMYESNAATDFGAVADQLIDACAGSVNCFGKFAAESLRAMLEKMYSDFGAGLDSKCASLIGTTSSGNFSRQQSFAQLLRMFLAEMYVDEFAKGLIPAFVYRMNRCTDADHEVLAQFMERGLPQLRAKFDESEYTSSLLYRLITFSEMWGTPTPSFEVMSARYEDSIMSLSDNGDGSTMVAAYCSFTQENSTACTGSSNLTTTSTSSSAIAYKKDKFWNVAATIPTQASVLLISSQPDARTPQKYADLLLAALNGTNKALFTLNYRAHGSLWRSPIDKLHKNETTAGMDTLVAFVQNSGDLSKLNIAYGVGGIPSYAVTATEQVSELLFLTTDAFEGTIFGSNSTSNSSTIIAVVVTSAAVVLLFGAGWFYYRRRRNARLQAEAASQDSAKAVDAVSPSTAASYELESRV